MVQEFAHCYVLIADEQSWKSSLKHNLWGLSEKTKGSWNTAQVGDWVAFYVTRPISRIMGFGKITKKFVDEDLVWPDEQIMRRSIWKYKLGLNVIYVLEEWENGVPVPSHILLNTGRKVLDRNTFISLAKTADRQWGTSILPSLKEK